MCQCDCVNDADLWVKDITVMTGIPEAVLTWQPESTTVNKEFVATSSPSLLLACSMLDAGSM